MVANLNMYTNRPFLEKINFFEKKKFSTKNFNNNFFNIGRFIHQNVKNQILRSF